MGCGTLIPPHNKIGLMPQADVMSSISRELQLFDCAHRVCHTFVLPNGYSVAHSSAFCKPPVLPPNPSSAPKLEVGRERLEPPPDPSNFPLHRSRLVEPRRLELLTPSVQRRCSPN
jgi:hypothetical protein